MKKAISALLVCKVMYMSLANMLFSSINNARFTYSSDKSVNEEKGRAKRRYLILLIYWRQDHKSMELSPAWSAISTGLRTDNRENRGTWLPAETHFITYRRIYIFILQLFIS